MELATTAVKTALDRFLDLHKDAKTDNEFMAVGFDVIQTLLNNIHMAQSHMFATLIGGIGTKYDALYVKPSNASNRPETPLSVSDTNDTNTNEYMTDYMTQFSNVSISSKNKGILSYHQSNAMYSEPLTPIHDEYDTIQKLNTKRVSLGLNPISAESQLLEHSRSSVGVYDKSAHHGSENRHAENWLQKLRDPPRTHNTVCTGLQAQCNATGVTHNSRSRLSPRGEMGLEFSVSGIFDEDDFGEPVSVSGSPCHSYNHGMWHDKVNMDVEQCCARIGNQLFMIDHMEPEFLDNYPPDTYIDENGIVHGRSCLRTIDTKLFEKGQIFCNDHAYGYTDIRTAHT